MKDRWGNKVPTTTVAQYDMYGKIWHNRGLDALVVKKDVWSVLDKEADAWTTVFFIELRDGTMMIEAGTLAIDDGWRVKKTFSREVTKEEGNEFYKKLIASKRINKKGKEYYILPR